MATKKYVEEALKLVPVGMSTKRSLVDLCGMIPIASGLVFSAGVGCEVRSRNCVVSFNTADTLYVSEPGSIRVTLNRDILDSIEGVVGGYASADDSIIVSAIINGTDPDRFVRTFSAGSGGGVDIHVYEKVGTSVQHLAGGYSLSFVVFYQFGILSPPYTAAATP